MYIYTTESLCCTPGTNATLSTIPQYKINIKLEKKYVKRKRKC